MATDENRATNCKLRITAYSLQLKDQGISLKERSKEFGKYAINVDTFTGITMYYE